jgi:hypothetical protein
VCMRALSKLGLLGICCLNCAALYGFSRVQCSLSGQVNLQSAQQQRQHPLPPTAAAAQTVRQQQQQQQQHLRPNTSRLVEKRQRNTLAPSASLRPRTAASHSSAPSILLLIAVLSGRSNHERRQQMREAIMGQSRSELASDEKFWALPGVSSSAKLVFVVGKGCSIPVSARVSPPQHKASGTHSCEWASVEARANTAELVRCRCHPIGSVPVTSAELTMLACTRCVCTGSITRRYGASPA